MCFHIIGVHHASIIGHMAGGAFDKPINIINNSVNFNCPNSIAITLPYYVGSDYYCEYGVNI